MTNFEYDGLGYHSSAPLPIPTEIFSLLVLLAFVVGGFIVIKTTIELLSMWFNEKCK